MAKLSSINKNNRRIKLSNRLLKKRKKLKKIIMDKKTGGIVAHTKIGNTKVSEIGRASCRERV